MSAIAAHFDKLRPEDIKTLNREASRSRDLPYVSSEPWRQVEQIQREIGNVKNSDLQWCIDQTFVGALDELAGRDLVSVDDVKRMLEHVWPLHMTLHCGLHFWPDANHRTAIRSFNLALERSLGLNVYMDEATALAMLAGSKALRPVLHGMRLLERHKLAQSDHPYRVYFGAFAHKLEVTDELKSRKGFLYSRSSGETMLVEDDEERIWDRNQLAWKDAQGNQIRRGELLYALQLGYKNQLLTRQEVTDLTASIMKYGWPQEWPDPRPGSADRQMIRLLKSVAALPDERANELPLADLWAFLVRRIDEAQARAQPKERT